MFLRYKSRRIGVQEDRPWHNFRSRDVNAKVVTELADLRTPNPKLVVRKAKNQPRLPCRILERFHSCCLGTSAAVKDLVAKVRKIGGKLLKVPQILSPHHGWATPLPYSSERRAFIFREGNADDL